VDDCERIVEVGADGFGGNFFHTKIAKFAKGFSGAPSGRALPSQT
jgi:hypothetical protein